jgi:hypothetical protein
MKEQKTLRRKIAEKIAADVAVLDRRPSELGFTEQIIRKDAFSTADAIIKQAKREFEKKQYTGCMG